MARKLRLEYSGAIYHVMNRGDRQEPIFEDDGDRERFLETLTETCLKTGWLVHAYCLMGNHFHLVVETLQANPVAGMQWLLGTYTARFNRRHRRFGHLFSGRYKSLIVDGSGTGYLRTVCEYVHLNPVRAKLLAPKQALREYRWSSFAEYLKAPSRRPAWLRVERVFGELRIPKDSTAARRRFEEFRKELLEQVHELAGAHHYGEEIGQSAEEKARRIIAEELAKLGWIQGHLSARRKGDAGKVRIARRLRQETTVSKRWIAEQLSMGSMSNVTFCLRGC